MKFILSCYKKEIGKLYDYLLQYKMYFFLVIQTASQITKLWNILVWSCFNKLLLNRESIYFYFLTNNNKLTAHLCFKIESLNHTISNNKLWFNLTIKLFEK